MRGPAERAAWAAWAACAALLFTTHALAQSGPGADASAAYRTLVARIDTYGHGDGHPYADGLAPQLDCWFGRANVPRARAAPGASAAAGIVELTVVRAATDDVTLLDRGWYTWGAQSGLHEKLVRLRRIGGVWLVVAMSAAARGTGCRADDVATLPPAGGRFARCQVLVAAAITEALSACSGPTGGGNGCAQAEEDVPTFAPSCVFGETFDLTRVTTPFHSLHDVPWATLPMRAAGPAPSSIVYGDVDGDGSEDAVMVVGREQPTLVVVGLSHGQLYELGKSYLPGSATPACSSSVRGLRVAAHTIKGTVGPAAGATQCAGGTQTFSVRANELVPPSYFDQGGA